VKVYIAGKITNNPGYVEQFQEAEKYLLGQGHVVMSPAVLPAGFAHHEYMKICFSMIDVCEGVYFLGNWHDSAGAKMEYEYAKANRKTLTFQ